jgi:hypothetical protein
VQLAEILTKERSKNEVYLFGIDRNVSEGACEICEVFAR